jgi:hypothetical protein
MAENSLVTSLKDWIRKYLMIFPYVRKKEFADIITNPDSAIPNEAKTSSIGKGFKDAAIPYVYSVLIMSIISAVIGLALAAAGLSAAGLVNTAISSVVSMAMSVVLAPIFLAIALLMAAVLYFIVAKILGGKGSFGKTFGMLGTVIGPVCLLSIITNVLSMIPVVACIVAIPALALGIYWLFLNFRMVKAVHGLGDLGAAVVVLVPILLAVVLAFVFAAALISTIGMSAFSQMPTTG